MKAPQLDPPAFTRQTSTVQTDPERYEVDHYTTAHPRATTSGVVLALAEGVSHTRQLLLTIDAGEVASAVHGRRELRITLEVDTDPPPGFSTETKFLLQPIPFSVKAYDPPSLFAGKMHAVLCREISVPRPSIFHWRTTNQEEVDFVVEAGNRLLAVEVKAGQRPSRRDARHLLTFQREYGDAVAGCLLLHDGPEILPLADGVMAAPWWSVL